MTPTLPPCRALGIKTAASTEVIATMALVICSIALRGALAGALLGGELLLALDAFDVLDDDDGIVDHDTDREHHAEQRQLIDGEAEGIHADEGAHQGDRHHEHRNH